eukprot:COSAG05_NODE_493_length_9295_cov_27.013158_8_plen_127_part_00
MAEEEPGNDAPSPGVESFENPAPGVEFFENPAGASEDLDSFAEIEEVDDGDVEEEKGNDAAAVVEDPAGGEKADEGNSREEISGVGNTPELRALFDSIDTDGGGSLDRSEIEQLCKKMGVVMTDGV